MITGINEWKTLTNNISCKHKCKLDGRKCKSDQKWNHNKCLCECEKHPICEKDCIWNTATCSCEIGKYVASIIYNSEIMHEKTIEVTKTIPTNFNEKIQSVKQKISIFCLPFY